MKLTVCLSGPEVERPLDEIESVISEVAQAEDGFFLLAKADAEFLQGASAGHGLVRIEYTESGVVGLFAAKAPLAPSIAVGIARGYLTGNPRWKEFAQWEVLDLGVVEEDVSLGAFEGSDLRRVVDLLEKNGVDFWMVQHNTRFEVIAIADHATEARRLLAGLFPH